jgi:tetratricopeptide (TPR) repeat protein
MNIKEKLNKIIHNRNIGNYADAFSLASKLIAKYPKQPALNLELGLLLIHKNNFKSAIDHLLIANKEFKNDEIKKQIINCYFHIKQFTEALELNQSLLQKYPTSVDIQMFQARILKELKNFEEAEKILRRLLEINFQISIACEYGFLLNLNNKFDKAIEIYEEILKKEEHLPSIYNLGIAYTNNKHYTKAEQILDKAIKINSNIDDFWFARSIAKLKQYKIESALSDLKEIEKINPKNKYAVFQQGVINANIGNDEEAMQCYLESIDHIKDGEENEAYFRLGLMLFRQKKFKEAMPYWTKRIDSIDRYKYFDDKNINETLSKEKNIVIHRDQGLGDELLFLRVIDDLILKKINITYLCHEKLFLLLEANFKNIKIIREYDGLEILNKKDVKKITAGTMLGLVNDPIKITSNSKKFKTNELLTNKLRAKYKLNNKKIIGLSWKSKNEAIGDYKSIPLNEFAPIFENSNDYIFINLQYGEVKDEIDQIRKKFNINIIQDDEVDCLNDLYGLSSLIEVCDYVITCSNITAHLAGWLKKETFILLPKNLGKLWYWNHQKSNKSEWYPTISIINQEENGSWKNEIKILRKILNNE